LQGRLFKDAGMALDWDDLKVALAVGRAGSLTRAAEALGIDQSTCGRRFAALEAALGAVLFVRSRAGLSATEAGEAVIARAGEVELRMERLSETLSAGDDGPAGLVRLQGEPWVLALLAERGLAALLAAHPRLDVRLASGPPRTMVRPDAAIGLWFDINPRDPEFALKLCPVPYAVYARADRDPAELPWVGHHDEDAPRAGPTRALERARKREERIRVTSADAAMQLAAIASGLGRGFLPMRLGEATPGLVRLPTDAAPLVRVLSLHIHPDTVQQARVQAVLRWLRATAPDAFGAVEFANGPDSG
jgi:DNA-binding transcriptional LysR family regulator